MATTENHHVRITAVHRLGVAWEQETVVVIVACEMGPSGLGFGKRFTRNASIISALAFGPSATQPRPREPEPATNLVHASVPSRPHVSLCSSSFPRPLLLDLCSTTSFCGIFSDGLLKVVCSRYCVHSFFFNSRYCLL
jgi:hypothetical protein